MDNSLFRGDLVTSQRVIYTPSKFTRSQLIHLQEIGELQARKPHTSQRENLASFLFFLVTSGSGKLVYQKTVYNLHAGDCVFIDCHKSYSHLTSEDDLWSLKWIHFYGPNMTAIYEKYVSRGGRPCFRTADQQAYIQIYHTIFDLTDSNSTSRDMKIYEKLVSLLSLLMEESHSLTSHSSDKSRKRNLQSVKEYIDTHYAEKITLDQLSSQYFINKFYLTRSFKDQFGTPVNSYLIQVRVTHAKQLLRFTDLPIEKIGQECGMSDANYFSRVFKKTEGVTPGEYRNAWRM